MRIHSGIFSRWSPAIYVWLCVGLLTSGAVAAELSPAPNPEPLTAPANLQTFALQGVIKDLPPDGQSVVIQHQAIAHYMAAMTMTFKVRAAKELAGLHPGDVITCQLHVSETESWIDQILKTGTAAPEKPAPASAPTPSKTSHLRAKNPLLNYKFTNELGQSVSLADFHGQALAITFFYTRCPLPEYCPRLSKNFQVASEKLAAQSGAPTNWHFLSFSFDSEFDTPETLAAYGRSYHYDPAHWSFLTGPADKIAALAAASDVTYQWEAGTINHNFRTLIIDATGHLQTIIPTSGDLSDRIAAEILQAATVTNPPTLN